MKAKHILIITPLLILLVGLGIWAYQGYQVYKNTRIIDCRISNILPSDWSIISIPSIPIRIPFPKKILIDFEIILENPSSASFEIRDVIYDVYVKDTYLGQGSRSSIIIIPGRNRLTFSFETRTEKLLVVLGKIIYEAIKRESYYILLDIEIKGVIRIPIKLFNIIEVPGWTITLPYQIRETHGISIPLPKGVIEHATYAPSSPSPGDTIMLKVSVHNKGGIKGTFFILVKVLDKVTGIPIIPEWKSHLLELEPCERATLVHTFKMHISAIIVEIDLYLLPLVLQDRTTLEIFPSYPILP